jgi:DNA-binding GntR family transcriptional regulator
LGGPKKKRGRPKHASEIGLDGSRRLDPSSAVPRYYQLGEILKEKLDSGTWAPGTLFPSERELQDHFEVSRSVVRPALDLLERDGAIYRVRGSGTFVASPKRSVTVTGLIRLLTELPATPLSISVLQTHDRCEDSTVAEMLQVPDDGVSVGQVTALAGLDEPLCVLDSFFSGEHVPWMLSAASSLGKGHDPQIPDLRATLTRAEGSIEGSSCGPWTASLLGVRTGDPALVGRLVQYGIPVAARSEHPLELTRIVARSDISKLHFDVS